MPSPFEKRRCCCSMIVFMHSSGKSYRSRFYRLTLDPYDLCEGGMSHQEREHYWQQQSIEWPNLWLVRHSVLQATSAYVSSVFLLASKALG